MLAGGLGWPEGGWPEAVSAAVLGAKRHAEARAKYEAAVAAERKRERAHAAVRTPRRRRRSSRRDDGLRRTGGTRREAPARPDRRRAVLAPDVSAGLRRLRQAAARVRRRERAADAGVLLRPQARARKSASTSRRARRSSSASSTSAQPDTDGRRAVSFELNGMAREAFIPDKSVAPKAKTRPKADLGDPLQVAAPIPGLVAALSVVGRREGGEGRQAVHDGSDEDADDGLSRPTTASWPNCTPPSATPWRQGPDCPAEGLRTTGPSNTVLLRGEGAAIGPASMVGRLGGLVLAVPRLPYPPEGERGPAGERAEHPRPPPGAFAPEHAFHVPARALAVGVPLDVHAAGLFIHG